jgi:hypothetical protein
MWEKVAVAAGVLLVALTGLLCRWWGGLADNDPALAEAAVKIQRLPAAVGPWRGRTLELDADDTARAGYAGALWRLYRHDEHAAGVSVLLVCGRPGRVAVHTPDACFKGVGYEMAGEPVRVTWPVAGSTGPAVFWKARFTKPADPSQAPLTIYWAWNAGDGWQAVEHPRLAFAQSPVLYKLYFVCDAAGRAAPDAGAELAQLLLAELRQALGSPVPAARAANDSKGVPCGAG